MSVPVHPHIYKEGDNKPAVFVRLPNFDATGWTITFALRRVDGTTIVKTPTVVDLTDAAFTFTWLDADLIEGDCQCLEIHLEDPGGSVQHTDLVLFNIGQRIHP